MKPLFLENELPVDDLVRVGLWKDDKPMLPPEDLQAMLAGRRTSLLTLENVQADGFLIKRLDVKLSLHRSNSGWVSLQAHPIHHEIQPHPLLNERDMKLLSEGEISSLGKTMDAPNGKVQSLVFEYDEQTREFISYSPSQVQAPDRVNGELLDKKKKEAFQYGESVELSDGTTFQHRASESKGIVSDRKALVLSVLLDGGISYLLIRGIRNLLNRNTPQKDEYTAGYNKAVEEMNIKVSTERMSKFDTEENRGNTRSRSR